MFLIFGNVDYSDMGYVLALIALVAIGTVFGSMLMDVLRDSVEEIFNRIRPAPKPPKPEKYHVKIVTPDGYPLRDYRLELSQVNRVMSGIHAELETEPKP